MDSSANATIPATAATNDTTTAKPASHNWEFLVGVLVTAICVSLLITLLAKCQVILRYLASYRHTRLREADNVSQCEPSVEFGTHGGRGINPDSIPPMSEEDDDGFIEDNYIPASERARAQREVENMDPDTEEEMDEIEFSIA